MTTGPGTPPDELDGLWVRCELLPDGNYGIGFSYGPDLAWLCTENAARRHAMACFRAATIAEHDAAVVALLQTMHLSPTDIGRTLQDIRVRRRHGITSDWPSSQLQWEPAVTMAGKPFLTTMVAGKQVGQSSPADVRDHATGVLNAMAAARLDEHLVAILTDTIHVDDDQARQCVHRLQDHWPPDPWPGTAPAAR